MIVSEILKKKKIRTVTMHPGDSIETAMHMFMDEKIGSIMVCGPRGDLLGMVTERDVMHGMATHGIEVLQNPVKDVMSYAHTCTSDDKVKDIMRQMTLKHVRHVPVIDDDKIIGLVSIGDLLRNQLDETQLEVDTLRDYARAH